MATTNNSVFDTVKSKKLAAKLSLLLANYSIFYQNTRGAGKNCPGVLCISQEMNSRFSDFEVHDSRYTN